MIARRKWGRRAPVSSQNRRLTPKDHNSRRFSANRRGCGHR